MIEILGDETPARDRARRVDAFPPSEILGQALGLVPPALRSR